jgi:hypothetical protein
MHVAMRIIYKVFNGSNFKIQMFYKRLSDELNLVWQKGSYVLDSTDLDDFLYYFKPSDLQSAITKEPFVFFGGSNDYNCDAFDHQSSTKFVRIVSGSPDFKQFTEFLFDMCEWVIENNHMRVLFPECCINFSWFTSDYAWFLAFVLGTHLSYCEMGILPSEEFPRETLQKVLEELSIVVPRPPLPAPTLESSTDQNAVQLLHVMMKKILVGVAPFYSQNEMLAVGSSLAGWGVGDHVIFPCHLLSKEQQSLCKQNKDVFLCVRRLDLTSLSPLNGSLKDMTVVKVTGFDSDRDLAIADLCDAKEIKEVVAKVNPDLRTSFTVWNRFSNFVLNHAVEEKWLVNNTGGLSILQYLPTTGLICMATAKFQKEVEISVNVAPVGASPQLTRFKRTGFDITGYSTVGCPTQGGDCGGPIIAHGANTPRKLLGFHTIGSPSYAFSQLVCLEYITELIAKSKEPSAHSLKTLQLKCSSSIPTLQGRVTRYIPDFPPASDDRSQELFKYVDPNGETNDKPIGPNVEIIGGLLLPNMAGPAKGQTQLKKAPFYGAFEEREAPRVLDVHDKRLTDKSNLKIDGKGKPSLLVTQISKYATEENTNIDLEILDYIVEKTVERDTFLFKEADLEIGTDWDPAVMLREVLNGDPNVEFLEPMELRAASGIPWAQVMPTKKQKRDFFYHDEDTGIISLKADDNDTQLLMDRFQLHMSNAMEGRTTVGFWKDCLKDEMGPVAAIEVGKTRTFSSAAIELVMKIRALFGRYKASYTKLGLSKNHGVGINVHSGDWSKLANHLSVHKNFLDADFSSFDRSIPEVIFQAAYKIVCDTIKNVHPDDEFHTARLVSAHEQIYSYMVGGDTVYRTHRGNKSGGPLTTIINCVVNDIYHWYCFIRLTGNRNYDVYRENVSICFYGDDVIASVSNEFASIFNFVNIKRIMEGELGQKYTPADKYGNGQFHSSLSTVTFLKRRFVNSQGFWLCPLNIDSIERVFNYSKIDGKDVDAWVVQLQEGLIEASLHGNEYFNEFTKKLRATINNKKRSIDRELRLRAYDICMRSHSAVWSDVLIRFGVGAQSMFSV